MITQKRGGQIFWVNDYSKERGIFAVTNCQHSPHSCEVIFNKQFKLASLDTSSQMLRLIPNPATSKAHEPCGNCQPLQVCSLLHSGQPRLPSNPPRQINNQSLWKRSTHLTYLSILGFNHDISRLTGWKTCQNGLNEFLGTLIETQDTSKLGMDINMELRFFGQFRLISKIYQ